MSGDTYSIADTESVSGDDSDVEENEYSLNRENEQCRVMFITIGPVTLDVINYRIIVQSIWSLRCRLNVNVRL